VEITQRRGERSISKKSPKRVHLLVEDISNAEASRDVVYPNLDIVYEHRPELASRRSQGDNESSGH
jgi:hypothetical protein